MKNQLASIILLVAGIPITTGCMALPSRGAAIYFFQDGRNVHLELDDPDALLEIVHELILGTDDMLHWLITDEDINKIKQEQEGIEVIWDKVLYVRSKAEGIYEIDRVLIPFHREYVGNGANPTATIFLGRGAYISGPLSNSNGLDGIRRLELLAEMEAQKQEQSP